MTKVPSELLQNIVVFFFIDSDIILLISKFW